MILELWINPTIGLQSGNNDCNWSSFYSGGKIIHSRDVLFMGLNFAVRVATVLIYNNRRDYENRNTEKRTSVGKSLNKMKLFAEYLGRIGRVSIVVEDVSSVELLQVARDVAKIRYIGVTDQDEGWRTQEVHLPAPVHLGNDTSTFTSYGDPQKHIYQLHLNASKSNFSTRFNDTDEESEKWSKSQLNKIRPFHFDCIACGSQLLQSTDFTRFSDMPSEYWRELMDYWHCHKPSIKNTPSEKGIYSSAFNHSLRPILTEILIGKAYFLVLPEAVNNCKVNSDKPGVLVCNECDSIVGAVTKDTLYKLDKWRLVLRDSKGNEDIFRPIDDVLGSLLEYAREQSGRYLLVKSKTKGRKILLWLFNTHIYVTLSNGQTVTNALKILSTKDEEVMQKTLEKHNVDEIAVEEEPYNECLGNLAERNGLLPSSLQLFGPWRVHYMRLFEK